MCFPAALETDDRRKPDDVLRLRPLSNLAEERTELVPAPAQIAHEAAA